MRKLFSITLYQFLTIDDDLSEGQGCQMFLSPRKLDVEIHVADCISDVMLKRYPIYLSGESVVDETRKLISRFSYERGEISHNSAIVPVYHGYVWANIVDLPLSCVVNSFALIPDNLILCLPFVAHLWDRPIW